MTNIGRSGFGAPMHCENRPRQPLGERPCLLLLLTQVSYVIPSLMIVLVSSMYLEVIGMTVSCTASHNEPPVNHNLVTEEKIKSHANQANATLCFLPYRV